MPTADPDEDQEVNLIEFALGRHPREREAAISSLALDPEAGQAGTLHPMLCYERPDDRLNALRYLVLWSDTLNPPHWQALLASELVTPLAGNRESVRLVDPGAFGSLPSRFYRLGAELKP